MLGIGIANPIHLRIISRTIVAAWRNIAALLRVTAAHFPKNIGKIMRQNCPAETWVERRLITRCLSYWFTDGNRFIDRRNAAVVLIMAKICADLHGVDPVNLLTNS
jgi:hypothetical protein